VGRVGHRGPDLLLRNIDVRLEEQVGVLARDDATRGHPLGVPARAEIDQPAAHLADVVIALRMGNETGQPQRIRARIGHQRVAA
jgi:hypothetical protein